MANFLDLVCPGCGRDDDISIEATVWLRVTADGTDAGASAGDDHDYTPRSLTACGHCFHTARFCEFETEGAS